jgi:hypothetical protein
LGGATGGRGAAVLRASLYSLVAAVFQPALDFMGNWFVKNNIPMITAAATKTIPASTKGYRWLGF